MHADVLVYGGTGTQGGPVVEQLLARGRRVRLVTRSADRGDHLARWGAEVVVADLGDPASLHAASEGMRQVVLQLPLQYDFDLHEAYGRNAIDAAAAAGVELLVLTTSAQVIDGTEVHAYRARQHVIDYLRGSSIEHLVFRPTFFMENLRGPWVLKALLDEGVIRFPLPEAFPMSWISAAETANYLVAALERPDLAGSIIDIGGPQPLSGADIAATFSAALQKPIAYIPITPDEYEQALSPIFGPTVASEVAAQTRYLISRGSGDVAMEQARATFGVHPTPLAEWIRQHPWNPAASASPTPAFATH